MMEAFQFKQLRVEHGASALPIGFDGVLLGAWTDVGNAKRVLDVGTGCGIIALMCAQRNPTAEIIGIDIHPDSVREASENFHNSPWSGRLEAKLLDYNALTASDLKWGSGIDLIISNPPFFNTGIQHNKAAGLTAAYSNYRSRLAARHIDKFGPQILIEHGSKLLTEKGSISLIFPAGLERELISVSHNVGLFVRRICRVSNTRRVKPKRILFQVSRQFGDCNIEEMSVRDNDGAYTHQYRQLTQNFYIK